MVLVTMWPSRAMMVRIVIFFLWIIIRHPRTVMLSGYFCLWHSPSRLCVMSRLWKWSWWSYGHQGPWWSKLWSTCSEFYSYIPEQICIWGKQAISAMCYIETMKMVLVTIWPSRAMMVQIVIFFLWIIVIHLWTDMCSRKTGCFGIVLCRDYENGLGDHVAINRHDGPTSYLRSLNYI
jgi:hypothetical protein